MAVLSVLMAACAARKPCDSSVADDLKSVYVVRRAWHTGIAIEVRDWPDRTWPVLADFPGARYLEFGWGEARYYQAEHPNWRMALAAALRPNPSVIEVRALYRMDLRPASDYEVVVLKLSASGLEAVARSIASTFASPAADTSQATSQVSWTGVERYEGGDFVRFYHARGKFFFPRMCNRWTAQQLVAGGCPLRPATVVSAQRVIRDARRIAAAQDQLGTREAREE